MSNSTQFLRTDKAIQSALMQLLKRKSFEKITVQDILDETPVSRATFYKHYHDKYEIVEKMQDEFLAAQKEANNVLASASPSQIPSLVQSLSSRYQDIMQMLLQVKTERVNLPNALMNEAQRLYLENSDSPTKSLEAVVYGAARTGYQIANLMENSPVSDAPRIFMTAMLKFLGLSDDPEVIHFLTQKMEQPR